MSTIINGSNAVKPVHKSFINSVRVHRQSYICSAFNGFNQSEEDFKLFWLDLIRLDQVI